MTSISQYADIALGLRERYTASSWPFAAIEAAIKSKGVFNPPDVKRLTKQVVREINSRTKPVRRRPGRHWRADAQGLTLSSKRGETRLILAELTMDHVLFRVQTGRGWRDVRFVYGSPCIKRNDVYRVIRLEAEVYSGLYWMSDALMKGVLAGYNKAYKRPSRTFHYVAGGARFVVRSVRAQTLQVIAEYVEYTVSVDDGVLYVPNGAPFPPHDLREFLFSFTNLVSLAYIPYKPKPVPEDMVGPLLASVLPATLPPIRRKRRSLVPLQEDPEPVQPLLL